MFLYVELFLSTGVAGGCGKEKVGDCFENTFLLKVEYVELFLSAEAEEKKNLATVLSVFLRACLFKEEVVDFQVEYVELFL